MPAALLRCIIRARQRPMVRCTNERQRCASEQTALEVQTSLLSGAKWWDACRHRSGREPDRVTAQPFGLVGDDRRAEGRPAGPNPARQNVREAQLRDALQTTLRAGACR